MKDKKASILLLAMVCLAGIALVVAQPASVVITNNDTVSNQTMKYPVKTNITDTEEAARTFNVSINQPVNDTTPPNVTTYAPTGTKVSVKTNITATFSEEMNCSTLNNATIIVFKSSSSTLTGNITYDSETNTAVTFDPLSELEYNETYNVTITTGVQDLAGNNMSSDCCWNFTTHREIKTPFMISGYVSYRNGNPVLNPKVTITNLNTTENFSVKTIPPSNYYRMITDSTHIRTGDMIRINVTDGTDFNETRQHIVTEEDIKNGGFRFKPDLIISKWSETWIELNKVFNITYTVKNIGDEDADESIVSIYIERSDGILKKNYSIEPLAPDESNTSTVGPFNCPCRDIKVCADGDNAVDESNERNNCLEHESNCPLPDLDPRTPWWKDEIWFWDDYENGKYKIQYGIENNGEENASESITTINITIVARNGTRVSSDIINHSVPALPSGKYKYYENTSRRFTCLYNHTVLIEVCADGYNEIFESDESNNCMNAEITDCPASVREPDLEIVNHSEEWIGKPANRTFNITYTVKNVGNAIANNSITCVHGREDPVLALEPGKSYTNTVCSFVLSGFRTTIKIHADCKNNVTESHDGEEENCIEYTFGLPRLRFEYWEGEWVRNKTFRVKYGVWSFGGAASDNTTVYAYIDGNDSRDKNVTDTLSPIPPYEFRYHNSIGPFEMPEDKEKVTYKLCMDRGDGVETCTGETVFGGGACVAEDGTRFTCGGFGGGVSRTTIITDSCTLTGDMYCPEGVLIRGNDIVIDGNGTGILGEKIGCTGTKDNPVTPDNHYETRGIRIGWPSRHNKNINNVTIKNMNIRGFCNGIAIMNADNSRIENCSVHDNGVEDGYTYGITVVNSSHVSIDRCGVYNNTGILTGMNVAGGHGINFHDDCNYCAVTNSHVFNNYLSGILASPTCKYLYIGNNTIEDNGQCNESGFCAGVNLHWKGGFGLTTNSTVENNTIQNNTGSGIYVTQSYTAIKNNTVKGGKKNDTDLNVNGDGILVDGGKLTFLYNNTCCDNEGVDIVNSEGTFATFGDDNTCDTTENYDDEGTTRGCIYKCGGSGACIADDGSGDAYRCGDTVMKSCTFNQNVSCPVSGDGLIVGARDITIDGAGYTLIGIFSVSGIGIFSSRSDVTIKNLQVKDFFTGITIENTTENIIENCVVRTNLLTGINFSADNGTVRNSRIYDNVGPGILTGGSNNVFENNTVAKNGNGTLPGYGIYLSPDAGNNNLTANFIGDNEYYDIYNDDGALNYNTSDNNTCDIAFNYWDVSMLKDKKYNCAYPWTMPDLVISDKFEKWVDEDSVRYNVTYTIENIGKLKSRPAERSTTWLKIWDVLRATDPIGTLKPGENYINRTFSYTPTIPEERDSDRIKVCADGADEVKENNPADIFYYKDKEWYSVEEFLEDKEANNCRDKDEKGKINEISKSGGEEDRVPEWGVACVCDDGWCNKIGREYYKCGDTVTESCTFENHTAFKGSMLCEEGGHGLTIGKDSITIDGAEHVISGTGTASCASDATTETKPSYADCGIYNLEYDNVKIKNLEILHFCNGIGLGGASDVVVGNTIENCEIHDNGNSAGKSHGIHMVRVKDTTIRNNDIHHNRGTGPSCGDGGNGIFLYAGTIPNANNMIVDNDLHGNDRAGFWTKMGMQDCTIKDNRIWGNSRGSGLGTMTGGLVLQCKKSDNNTIENNEVKGNYGRCGIFVGGNCNNLTKNNVHDNKGDGINIGRCDGGSTNNHLKNVNTVCDNGGVDIRTCGDGDEDDYENDGAGNFCDRTRHYKDANAAEGCKCWQPCSNVSKPDLKVTEKFETWIVEGENYTVTYTVQNVGKADAPHSTTLIQIVNRDPEYDYSVPSLPPNESYTNEVGPFTTSGESDTITVHADTDPEPAKWVEEDGLGSRDNNCLTNTWTALPDLTVTKIEVPGELSLFKSNTVTAKIGNIGTVKTDADEALTVALFVDGSASHTDTAEVSGLDADGSIPVPLSWTPGIAKDYKLRVFVDCYDKVDEGSNEGNNNLTKEITEETVDYDPLTGLGGGRPPAGEENISGYEPRPGEGTGEFGKDTGTKGQINESSVSGEEKWKKGNPFYGMGGEIIENVKVVAPVFLIIMIVIFVALFYSGYFSEQRGHRRNNR